MSDEIIIETTSQEVVEVGVPGPQGPAGAAGTGLETLTTQGDTLYRGASTGQRLPIGTVGQILKVSAGGIPEWGAAPASGVSSVNGETGAVTVAAALHAAEHEAGEADEIQAMAALVATDVLALNGVYFHDGTLTSGRPNFFRTGTRKNTKLVYNSGTGQWNLVRNLTIEAVGVDGPDTVPWGNDWENFVTPTSVTVTRLGLEDMTQKLAETGSAATATTSQDGLISAADLTKLNGIAAGAEVNVNADWNASSGDAQILNKPSTFAPSSHASSHFTAGSDPLAPSDIQAQSIFSVESLVITTTTQVTLTAARAKIYDVVQYAGAQVDVKLPSTNALQGDIIVLRWGTGGDSIRIIQSASGSPITTVSSGEQKRFIRGATDIWSLVPVDTHTHPASAISDSTTAGRALLTGADAAAQRTSLGLGTAATSATGDFAAASHAHGNINSSGQVGSTAGLPLVTTTAGAVTTLALGTANQVLRTKSDLSGVEFADPAAAGVTSVTGTAPIVSSGGTTPAISVTVGTGSNTVAAGDDSRFHTRSHAITSTSDHTAGNHKVFYSDGSGQIQELALGSSGQVLTSNGATSAPSFAAASGGVSNVDSTLADVMSVSGSNLVADDGGLVDSSNPALVWDDAAGKAVWANPLRRTSAGAFYVGVAPTTTALGTRAINIQADRSLSAARIATGTDAVLVGNNGEATGTQSTAIGHRSRAIANYAFSAGTESTASGSGSIVLGYAMGASATDSVSIGSYDSFDTASFGASAQNTLGVHQVANLRGQVSFRPFRSVYWGGQTTSDTANVELNLDATATNRMTIAANTAVLADISLIARRTDNSKFLAARRWVAIRRDGSNNTALIGAVQTIGTDQSEGSPTWTFTIDADDTASVESLRVRVTGAASETVNWRVCAIYRVVA